MTENLKWGTTAFIRARQRELMPPEYLEKIKKGVATLEERHGGRLADLEIRALVVYHVLHVRLLELERDTDFENLRLESAAKLDWTSRQITRVKNSKSYKSAKVKINS